MLLCRDLHDQHMMVAADLATADAGGVEDALVAARELQHAAN